MSVSNSSLINMGQLLQDIDNSPEIPVVLPQQVQNFCNSISTSFESTAKHLDAMAERMEMAAIGMRERAKRLRDAAPDVRTNVETWIIYERESHQKHKFYEPLFK